MNWFLKKTHPLGGIGGQIIGRVAILACGKDR